MIYRLFFAIWPQPAVQQQIQSIFAHYDWPKHAKPIAVADWHITLRFLGKATEQQYQELIPLIAQIQCPTFCLSLDRLVYGATAELLWLESSVIPQALDSLIQQLNGVLKLQHWKIEKRDYKAHLTLARHFPEPPHVSRLLLGPLATPIVCHVNKFCLVDGYLRTQGKAAHYQILRSFKLQGHAM